MKLIQPIIDRTRADVKNRTAKGYFNVADWRRVYQNSQLLRILLGLIAYPARFYELPEPTLTDLPTAERLNTLLGNIQRIREASVLPAACGITDIKTDWKAGASSSAPNYTDANAWEALEKKLAESILTVAQDKVYCGVAHAGQSRVRQRNFRPLPFVEAAETPTRKARMGNAQTGTGLNRQNSYRRYS
jgi:hypothetical protein